MTMREGDRWICSNPGCCEIQVLVPSGSTTVGNPVCSCGSAMRKEYIAPQLRMIRDPDELRDLQEKFFTKVR